MVRIPEVPSPATLTGPGGRLLRFLLLCMPVASRLGLWLTTRSKMTRVVFSSPSFDAFFFDNNFASDRIGSAQRTTAIANTIHEPQVYSNVIAL